MVQPLALCAYFAVQAAMVYSQFPDLYYNDNNHMVIGNLRRREVRPLNPYFSPYSRRRYGADVQTNLNYRRTKDIRDKEDIVDRRFEVKDDFLFVGIYSDEIMQQVLKGYNKVQLHYC